jgi:hypothetical protein
VSDTRNLGRVLDLLADVLQQDGPTTRAIQGVEVVRTDRGMAAALILILTDGDRWTIAAAPHRTSGEDDNPATQRAAGLPVKGAPPGTTDHATAIRRAARNM